MTEARHIPENFGILILAAGSSSRLGRPKQLLQFEGETLLHRQVKVATQSIADVTVVVLGANASVLADELAESNVHFVINDEYAEGIASSIRFGLKGLVELEPLLGGVVIMVSDQPFVTASLIDELLATHVYRHSSIVTCSYDNTFGPPTFFHKSHFPELLQLTGDTGARKVIQQHMNTVSFVPFSKGGIDIDTEEDYEKLMGNP